MNRSVSLPAATSTHSPRRALRIGGLLLAVGAGIAWSTQPAECPVAAPPSLVGRLELPLLFEAHPTAQGGAGFLARGRGATLRLERGGASLQFRPTARAAGAQVRMRWPGSNPRAVAKAEERAPGRVDYFLGNDPTRWTTEARVFQKVRYRALFPGVDLVCYGRSGTLEYDFVVAPHADPRRIRIAMDTVRQSSLTASGDLLLQTAAGPITHRRPVAYQEVNGRRRAVPARFRLASAAGTADFGFELGAYDRSQPLVIDPILDFSSYLGGTGADEANDVAVTTSGSTVYLTGTTASTDFPTANPLQPAAGSTDLFVTVLADGGRRLIYSAYLGGSSEDTASSLAVDAAGKVYVTGTTASRDFPPVSNIQRALSGATDAVLATLDPSRPGRAALVFSTYLGGVGDEQGRGVAVAPTPPHRVYVTGTTSSADDPLTPLTDEGFPITSNAYQPASGGGTDAFLAVVDRLDPDEPRNARLQYATYLGGASDDRGWGIALGPGAVVQVTGAASPGFPTTPGAYCRVHQGGASDAFLAVVDPGESGPASLLASTFLGGEADDEGRGVAVDELGIAYLTGFTTSADFPAEHALKEISPGLRQDAFAAQLTGFASTLRFCSTLGGTADDVGTDVAVSRDEDVPGQVTLVASGTTCSPDLHLTRPVQDYAGNFDAFVVRIELPAVLASPKLSFYTYYGGSGNETGGRLALDARGRVFLSGGTTSADAAGTPHQNEGLPLAQPLQPVLQGASDAFLARLDPAGEGRLRVTPRRLQFGKVELNTKRERRVRVSNPGRGALRVMVGTPALPFSLVGDFTGGALYLLPGEHRDLRVRFKSPARGEFHGTLALTGSGTNNASQLVRLIGKAR